jgi:hypothetical protein
MLLLFLTTGTGRGLAATMRLAVVSDAPTIKRLA